MAQSLFKTLSPLAIVGIEGTKLAPRERELLSEAPPAGVILFARNVEGAKQLTGLVAEIEEVFAAAGARPPIIAADHEGGIVSVLARAIGTPPSQMAAGRAGAPLVRRLFEENALRMRACGVNTMLGPVADVNSERLNPIIGTRSFGEDVDMVAACVREAVAAAKSSGLLTCLKHFPGHGPTRADSHTSLPVLGAALEELREKDFVPFVRGFEAGADSVMVAHVVPAGRTLPASLDREIVTGVLREELGFGGVIMTDALEMAGARVGDSRGAAEGASAGAARPLAETCRLALEAGNDILLFSNPVVKVAEELEAGGAAADRSGFRSDEFAGRLAIAGVRIDALTSFIKRAGGRGTGRAFNDNVYREIARSSMRVVEPPESVEPLIPGGALKVTFISEMDMFKRPPIGEFADHVWGEFMHAGWGIRLGSRPDWAERLAKARGGADAGLPAGLRGHDELGAAMFSFGPESDKAAAIVVLMNRRPLDSAAIKELCAGANSVVVAEWPYAADLLEAGRRCIVTYGVYDAAAELVCSKLISRTSC